MMLGSQGRFKWAGIALFVGILAISLSGCALLDHAFGVTPPSPDNPGSADPGGGIVGGVGRLAGSIPGWGWLVSLILSSSANLYQNIRMRNYRAAAKAVIRGVDVALDHGTSETATKGDIYSAVTEERASMPQSAFIERLIEDLKNELRIEMLKK
jgi:hypothetical protein